MICGNNDFRLTFINLIIFASLQINLNCISMHNRLVENIWYSKLSHDVQLPIFSNKLSVFIKNNWEKMDHRKYLEWLYTNCYKNHFEKGYGGDIQQFCVSTLD